MIERIAKLMSNLVSGKKKNFFSYLLYGILLLILGIGVISKFLLTTLVLNKKRLE
jgi:hypothetical protein